MNFSLSRIKSFKLLTKFRVFVIFFILLFTLSCGETGGPGGGEGSGQVGSEVNFKMIRVSGGLDFFTGIDDSGSGTVATDYWIAETEVTYELWSTVYSWATVNGYIFINPGRQGGDIFDGPVGTEQQPVTNVSWRDVMVWCNALTEWYNAQKGTLYRCVYTIDSGFTTPIRTSSGEDTVDITAGHVDNPYVNPSAKGFRIPTNDEWELAARYIEDKNNDNDIKDVGEYYPGTHASGDESSYCFTTDPDDVDISTIFGNYAVYGLNSGSTVETSSSATVKSKDSNALGLYDMSGNVEEWCFDWHPSKIGSERVIKGGQWLNAADFLQVGYQYCNQPQYVLYYTGFRVVRND